MPSHHQHYLNLSPTAENILVSIVISRHHLTFLTILSWTSERLLLF